MERKSKTIRAESTSEENVFVKHGCKDINKVEARDRGSKVRREKDGDRVEKAQSKLSGRKSGRGK